jgi:hypothetical protein
MPIGRFSHLRTQEFAEHLASPTSAKICTINLAVCIRRITLLPLVFAVLTFSDNSKGDISQLRTLKVDGVEKRRTKARLLGRGA